MDNQIEVTEEEMINLVTHTTEERHLYVNFLDSTISTQPENEWALKLLEEWRDI